jgi:hypothetical protein
VTKELKEADELVAPSSQKTEVLPSCIQIETKNAVNVQSALQKTLNSPGISDSKEIPPSAKNSSRNDEGSSEEDNASLMSADRAVDELADEYLNRMKILEVSFTSASCIVFILDG